MLIIIIHLCLSVLQGVTCAQELAEVLVSMLPYCFKFDLDVKQDGAQSRDHLPGILVNECLCLEFNSFCFCPPHSVMYVLYATFYLANLCIKIKSHWINELITKSQSNYRQYFSLLYIFKQRK